MGSKTIEGVWFQVFSHDHSPPHVHGSYGSVLVIVDLLLDGTVQESSRQNAITPAGGKRSDVRHVFEVALRHYAELKALWEKMHGTASR